jgi:hypothetical protein
MLDKNFNSLPTVYLDRSTKNEGFCEVIAEKKKHINDDDLLRVMSLNLETLIIPGSKTSTLIGSPAVQFSWSNTRMM